MREAEDLIKKKTWSRSNLFFFNDELIVATSWEMAKSNEDRRSRVVALSSLPRLL